MTRPSRWKNADDDELRALEVPLRKCTVYELACLCVRYVRIAGDVDPLEILSDVGIDLMSEEIPVDRR